MPRPGISLKEVQAHLARMSREELLDPQREELAQSDALLERLRLRVARTVAGDRRLATFRAALENAIEVDHFVEDGESCGYFDRIERTIGEIRPVGWRLAGVA